jgi:hypothetical protein
MKLIYQLRVLAVCLTCNDKLSAASDAKGFRLSPEQPVLFSYVTSFLSFVQPLAFYLRPQGLLGMADGNRCISGRFHKYNLRVSLRNFCSEHYTKGKYKKVTNIQYSIFRTT